MISATPAQLSQQFHGWFIGPLSLDKLGEQILVDRLDFEGVCEQILVVRGCGSKACARPFVAFLVIGASEWSVCRILGAI
jgi:hypothetical protein